MPVLYEIDIERGLVRTTCAGFVTFEQVMAHFAALERDPRRRGVMDVILDLRHIASTPETSQLRQVAERMAEGEARLHYGRCAIVAVDPEHVGIGRLFAEFARDRFLASTVVATLDDAERWLFESPAAEAAG
ncbi:MAG TPA: hypothetical protein VLV86_04255 [Vicinamibacterales bacterium]|nr:hypothetical protein [Vicinamibacterales bacterium]